MQTSTMERIPVALDMTMDESGIPQDTDLSYASTEEEPLEPVILRRTDSVPIPSSIVTHEVPPQATVKMDLALAKIDPVKHYLRLDQLLGEPSIYAGTKPDPTTLAWHWPCYLKIVTPHEDQLEISFVPIFSWGRFLQYPCYGNPLPNRERQDMLISSQWFTPGEGKHFWEHDDFAYAQCLSHVCSHYMIPYSEIHVVLKDPCSEPSDAWFQNVLLAPTTPLSLFMKHNMRDWAMHWESDPADPDTESLRDRIHAWQATMVDDSRIHGPACDVDLE